MSCIDDLFQEVAHGRIAYQATSNKNATGTLRSQLMFEALKAGLGRSMDDLIKMTSVRHVPLQGSQPLPDVGRSSARIDG